MPERNDDEGSRRTATAELETALGEGDPARVRALVGAGADIRYKREGGYDALLDAVHSRDMGRDPRLLELLSFLVAQGVDLNGQSAYRESGLRVLSRVGRFDAVRLLLAAGADGRQLEWTPLMAAVALGTPADVQAALKTGADLEARDWWDRTAWLMAILTGDIAKTELLRDRGADVNARGRCGCPPLFYAIDGDHTAMLRWLLAAGQDAHQTDDFGTTTLIEAVGKDSLELVQILLDAGADVDAKPDFSALDQARSRAVVLRLLDAGADPAELSDEGRRALLISSPEWDNALDNISEDDFRRAHTRTFGASNPEEMTFPFWEAMVRCGSGAYTARAHFLKEPRGELPSPVWCAQRFGQSFSMFSDGRAVQIGGEHEDFYDPDFCIYNDVFVHGRDGSITIFGYPEAVFPPTDFHTATLIGDDIYVIGRLGYHGTRRPGATPVYRLDLRTMRMERLDTRGEMPGWVYRHRAVAVGPRAIRVWGGQVVHGSEFQEIHGSNPGSFTLHLDSLVWRRE